MIDACLPYTPVVVVVPQIHLKREKRNDSGAVEGVAPGSRDAERYRPDALLHVCGTFAPRVCVSRKLARCASLGDLELTCRVRTKGYGRCLWSLIVSARSRGMVYGSQQNGYYHY